MTTPALASLPTRNDTGYKRGRAFPVKLYRVQPVPAIYLAEATAEAFLAMLQAAWLEAGLDLRLSQGFRTMAEQTRIYDERYTLGVLNLVGRAKGPAAKPGFSNHQAGEAIDVDLKGQGESAKVYKWLADNASRFGFKRTVAVEPWHWEYDGSFIARVEEVVQQAQAQAAQTAQTVTTVVADVAKTAASPAGKAGGIGLIVLGVLGLAWLTYTARKR